MNKYFCIPLKPLAIYMTLIEGNEKMNRVIIARSKSNYDLKARGQ